MTTWQATHSRLAIQDDTVRLEPDGVTCSGDDFLAGTLNDAVLRAFDLMTLAEARALLREARQPVDLRITPQEVTPLVGRPRIHRDAHNNDRGRVWFFGRTLAIDVKEKPRVSLDLRTAAGSGMEAYREDLGDELVDTVIEAARALSPLLCFCGTGWLRFHEHDALLDLSRCHHPRTPIDHKAMTARCRICGRWWTLEVMGDSHYSYHYSVRQFEPEG